MSVVVMQTEKRTPEQVLLQALEEDYDHVIVIGIKDDVLFDTNSTMTNAEFNWYLDLTKQLLFK